MANDNEPAKLLLPYLQRADELQKHEPLVAYYCNFNLSFLLSVSIVCDGTRTEDSSERANTAKTFYAASIFFEILNQFGEPQPDLEQKQKYAVWKAADIRKALKEGRKPIPGPPGGDKDLSVLSSTSSGEYV
ncbi:hypothetical protein ACJIZ3_006985 [Penstemon smallii]|uniref:Vta1/callose synthase N-terminal domain-containing protein n=1 Tax=Penstemon smallii TaxID=265156 RepID=A0ABD3S9J1_9LAMI